MTGPHRHPENTIRRAEIVKALKKYPGMPARTMARMMHKGDPALFPSIESTRSLIRVVTGTSGESKRKAIVDKSLFRPKKVSGADPWEDMMPESWSEPIVPFILPKSIRSLLVLSDIHVPFHDIDALKIAVKYGIAAKPDAVLLNGDTLDFYAISDHEKDPRKVKWQGELEAGRAILRMVRSAFPNIPVYFKEGNHDFRLERHLMKHAPVLIGMPEFEIPTLLRFAEVGVQHIANKRLIYAGELTIGHGDEWKGGGGMTPARWAGMKAKDNVLLGHFHRISEHIDTTIRGKSLGYWSTGCLCEKQPQYHPHMNNWHHGFAMVHVNEDGSFEVDNKKIINGKVR
jgi:predicted phosphodiesterase